MSLYIILSTLALILGLFITYLLHSRHHLDIVVTPSPYSQSPTPFISVVVPARNEERHIRRCLESLLDQSYSSFEVIVVDDRSTDATPHILVNILREIQAGEDRLTSGRLRLLQGKELPPGWAGKPHALAQGAAVARGEWLCFVDADTFASPQLLNTTIKAAQEYQADLFTILTEQELGTFWEKVVLPLVFTGLSFGFPARRVNDPDKPDAIANGQFILIRRPVYEAVGGHLAVWDRIDEDKALAEAVKRAGYRLIVTDGRALARTRMYTSLGEMWEGWTKNIYYGLRDRLWLLLFGAILGIIGALVLPLWLLAGLTWWARGGGLPAASITGEAVFLWAALLWVRMRAAREFNISPLYAFTLPLGAVIFTAMMIASTVKVLSGKGVTWRGRTYSSRSGQIHH